MKKLLCVVLGLAILGGIALTAGCGGGGSGGGSAGVLAAFAAVLIIAASASSGGAGVAAFAASERERPRSAIMPADGATAGYVARIFLNGVLATETFDLVVADSGKTLKFARDISLNVSSSQFEYRVEFAAKGSSASSDKYMSINAMFAQYGTVTYSNSEPKTLSPTVDSAETAYALTYDAWRKANATKTLTYTDFIAKSPDISTVQTSVENDLKNQGTTADPNFKFSDTTSAEAQTIAQSTSTSTTKI